MKQNNFRPRAAGFFSGIIVTIVLLSGCTMNKVTTEEKTITLRPTQTNGGLTLLITTGDTWSRTMKAGPMIFNVLPQFVLWTEGPEGEYGETLYITGADGKMRNAKKKELGADFYRQTLPLWSSRAEKAGIALPSQEKVYPDTVTSATPTFTTTLELLPPSRKAAYVFLEINQSSDDNETYNEDNNDWQGQPSLIYRAKLPESGTVELALIGHGGMVQDKPEIYEDLSLITTARQMINSVSVRKTP